MAIVVRVLYTLEVAGYYRSRLRTRFCLLMSHESYVQSSEVISAIDWLRLEFLD